MVLEFIDLSRWVQTVYEDVILRWVLPVLLLDDFIFTVSHQMLLLNVILQHWPIWFLLEVFELLWVWVDSSSSWIGVEVAILSDAQVVFWALWVAEELLESICHAWDLDSQPIGKWIVRSFLFFTLPLSVISWPYFLLQSLICHRNSDRVA